MNDRFDWANEIILLPFMLSLGVLNAYFMSAIGL
jgi:hypothetical protein